MRVEIETDRCEPEVYAASVVEVLKLKGDIALVAPGSLPNDGKVIADERDYS